MKQLQLFTYPYCYLFLISIMRKPQLTIRDQKMVASKAENLEATVRKLVSFGTRHTLSDTKAILEVLAQRSDG
jgi:hypothetical protein